MWHEALVTWPSLGVDRAAAVLTPDDGHHVELMATVTPLGPVKYPCGACGLSGGQDLDRSRLGQTVVAKCSRQRCLSLRFRGGTVLFGTEDGQHLVVMPLSVKGIYPAPHIHEHLRYTIMATALRTPSRITTSRLSTLR